MLINAISQSAGAYDPSRYSISIENSTISNQMNLDESVTSSTSSMDETKESAATSITSEEQTTDTTQEEDPLSVLYGELELSDAEQAQIAELKRIDAQVRQHEQAHMAAGGALINGGANFEYIRGPDGVLYAVGGEVSINVSPGKSPEETIQRAQQIRRAALAPANPSAADRSVAAAASRMEMEARMELLNQQSEQQTNPSGQSYITREAISTYNSISQEDTSSLLNLFA